RHHPNPGCWPPSSWRCATSFPARGSKWPSDEIAARPRPPRPPSSYGQRLSASTAADAPGVGWCRGDVCWPAALSGGDRDARTPLASHPGDHHHLVAVVSARDAHGAGMTPDDDVTEALVKALESLSAPNRELELLEPEIAGHLVEPFDKESARTGPLQFRADHDAQQGAPVALASRTRVDKQAHPDAGVPSAHDAQRVTASRNALESGVKSPRHLVAVGGGGEPDTTSRVGDRDPRCEQILAQLRRNRF